jgi:hypothetical protein
LKVRTFHHATASADLLVLDVCPTDVTLELNFDELRFYYEPEYLDDMPHYLICRYGLDQTNRVFGLEICDRILDASNYSKVVLTELQLCIDVDLIRNFP